MERVVSRVERIEQRRESSADGSAGDAFEPRDPRVEGRGIIDGQNPIRPPRGIDGGHRMGTSRQRAVTLKRVGRIVRGADHGHAERGEQPQHREARLAQSCVAGVEHLARRRPRQADVNAERAPELHMRPVVEGVAQRVGHDARPRVETLPIRRIAGDDRLVDAVGAHRPPLVVVAVQPQLGDRTETVVGRHLVRRQVRVVVDDRQRLGEAMVEIAGHARVEEEFLVEKATRGRRGGGRHHARIPSRHSTVSC